MNENLSNDNRNGREMFPKDTVFTDYHIDIRIETDG